MPAPWWPGRWAGHHGDYNVVGSAAMLLKMEAYHDGECWCARGIGEDIFTQGETLDELVRNIAEAVELHYEGSEPPAEVLLLSDLKVARAEAA